MASVWALARLKSLWLYHGCCARRAIIMKLALVVMLALTVGGAKICNPKKNTSCCRAPRQARATPAASRIYPATGPGPAERTLSPLEHPFVPHR